MISASVAAGQYRVRGYLVTDKLKAEGIAYHFNDWVEMRKRLRSRESMIFASNPEESSCWRRP